MLQKNVQLLDATAKKIFLDAARESARDSYVPDMATVQRSTKKTESMPHLSGAPKMEEFKDEVVFTPIPESSFSLTNSKYQSGISIPFDDYDDDQLGGYRLMLAEMGDEAVLLPNALLIAALRNGTTNAGYDGVALFHAAHPLLGVQAQGVTQSNLLTGSGTSTDNIISDLSSSIARMESMRKDNGRPMGTKVRRVTIASPTTLRRQMLEAIRATEVASTSNVALKGIRYNLILDPELDADGSDYYVMNAGARVRALILQERRKFDLEAEPVNTGVGFSHEIRRYKSTWRGVVGNGRYQAAVKVNN